MRVFAFTSPKAGEFSKVVTRSLRVFRGISEVIGGLLVFGRSDGNEVEIGFGVSGIVFEFDGFAEGFHSVGVEDGNLDLIFAVQQFHRDLLFELAFTLFFQGNSICSINGDIVDPDIDPVQFVFAV